MKSLRCIFNIKNNAYSHAVRLLSAFIYQKGCNVLYDLKDIRVYQQNIVKEITREVTIIRSLPINGVQ